MPLASVASQKPHAKFGINLNCKETELKIVLLDVSSAIGRCLDRPRLVFPHRNPHCCWHRLV